MSCPPDDSVRTDLPGSREAAGRRARILVVDADAALAMLLEEWLSEAGCEVVAADAAEAAEAGAFDLVLVDVPFPRRVGTAPLGRMTNAHPPPPIIALSSTFFAGVDGNAAIARALGVTGVLAKPLDRDALIALVKRLVR